MEIPAFLKLSDQPVWSDCSCVSVMVWVNAGVFPLSATTPLESDSSLRGAAPGADFPGSI